MAGKNQITGGAFQDFEGNRLAYGYITLQLSHDEQESVDPGQVVGGVPITIPLDLNGNVSGSPAIWPNDQLAPANSFYIVNAFRKDGTLAWLSPQQITITSSPSPFNLGNVTPTLPATPGTGLGGITLQTNGVNNSNQSLLNIAAGTNVTAVNSGGTVTLSASGGGTVPAGQNIIQSPSFGGSTVYPQNGSYLSTVNTLGGTIFQQVSSGMLLSQPTNWKATIATASASTVVTLVIIKCTRGTGTVVSSQAVTFGGNATPTLSPAALYQSDSISFAITTGFDYYFACNSSTNLMALVAPGGIQAGNSGGTQITASNALPIGSSLPSWTSSISEANNALIFDWRSA
jgi:hypothetical protein